MLAIKEHKKFYNPSQEIQTLSLETDFERIVFLTHHQLFAVETARGL